MSDQNDMLKLLYDNNKRLKQTETREVPGNVPGFSQFYDVGTYVPTYQGGTTGGVTTYTIQQGAWARVGALLFVTGTIAWTAATGTGDARISLPFAVPNVTNQNFTGSLRASGVTFANGSLQVLIQPNTQYFIMQSPLTNASPTTVAIEAAATVVFSINYLVA